MESKKLKGGMRSCWCGCEMESTAWRRLPEELSWSVLSFGQAVLSPWRRGCGLWQSRTSWCEVDGV